MTLKSFLEKFFLGETLIGKINSPINREIKIYDGWFGKSVRVGGVTQSGELVKRLWKVGQKEYKKLKIKDKKHKVKIKNILICGLGCGTLAKSMSQNYPESEIVGIEIDPMMVEMGEKYFRLGKIRNLKIIIGDAVEKIKNKKLKIKNTYKKFTNKSEERFDLILIDIYQGKEYPEEAESREFIHGVKSLLNEDGVVIFNRLSYGEFNEEAVEFSKKLRDSFPRVWTKRAVTNLLIFCSQ